MLNKTLANGRSSGSISDSTTDETRCPLHSVSGEIKWIFKSEKGLSVAIMIWTLGILLIFISVFLFIRVGSVEPVLQQGLVLTISVLFFALGLAAILSWFTTFYVVSEHQLIISVLFCKKRIPFDQIKSITKTNTLLAGPALSVRHRLIIVHKTGTFTVISPVRQDEFIAAIRKRHPDMDLYT